MIWIDLMIKSKFTYKPTYDEWLEFWILLKDDQALLEDPYINDVFSVWQKKGELSPRQTYFIFKQVFPKNKIGKPPPKKHQPLKDFLQGENEWHSITQ
jgi:hypothetical protein